MKSPEKYETILYRKVEYYGETKAAYQFAAEEYASQFKLSQELKEYMEKQFNEKLNANKLSLSILNGSEPDYHSKHYKQNIEKFERFINELKTLTPNG